MRIGLEEVNAFEVSSLPSVPCTPGILQHTRACNNNAWMNEYCKWWKRTTYQTPYNRPVATCRRSHGSLCHEECLRTWSEWGDSHHLIINGNRNCPTAWNIRLSQITAEEFHFQEVSWITLEHRNIYNLLFYVIQVVNTLTGKSDWLKVFHVM